MGGRTINVAFIEDKVYVLVIGTDTDEYDSSSAIVSHYETLDEHIHITGHAGRNGSILNILGYE
jgi:hypothetical protein|eukprot:scaffold253_cov267-Chaetoceros_neogracile.AAC.31